MKLVVGLGNPGDEYARTRHNVGFMVADRLALLARARFTAQKFAAELAEARLGPERVWIMKPQTYMNHSGDAVGAALRFWKLDLDDLLVVHDELELDPYRVQLKVGGGHGGHNGVKSVNAHLGGPDYARVRVGVGRPPAAMDPTDYVLGSFRRRMRTSLTPASCGPPKLPGSRSRLGASKAMNQVNRRGPGRPARNTKVDSSRKPARRRHGAGGAGTESVTDSSRRANRRYKPEGSDMAETKNFVREYETIYLIKAETPDDQVDEIKERLRGIVSREGGKVIRFTNQGKRKTAFPVAKNSKALYMHCLYVGRPGLVQEFERNLKMIDVVTKFQSVRIADEVDFDSRQVEPDVKIQPVEEESKPREERGEFAAGDEAFEGEPAEGME